MGSAERPYKAHISWAAARPCPSHFHMMGRGPPQPIKFSDDGPRPGPVHHISIRWAVARPDPSNFQNSRPGPARPTNFQNSRPGPARPIEYSKLSARPRPGPSHFHFFRLGPARPITFSKISARPGSADAARGSEPL